MTDRPSERPQPDAPEVEADQGVDPAEPPPPGGAPDAPPAGDVPDAAPAEPRRDAPLVRDRDAPTVPDERAS